MAQNSPAAVTPPSPAAGKVIAALVGLVSLGVLVQAVTAGVFAREQDHKGLIDAHSGIAYLIGLLALVAVIVALVMWRGKAGGSAVIAETVALLVAVIIQIGIGGQIGDLGKSGTHPGLLAVHIPLALIIFGLCLHLSTYVADLRRSRP
jgi:hypothetical protein